MILQVLVAYDAKAHAFCQPFYVSHVDLGIRAFMAAANTPGQELNKHPEDFTLFHIGAFNDENARFILLNEPLQVAFAANLKQYPQDLSQSPAASITELKEAFRVQPKVA